MKKATLLCSMLLAVVASSATAGGLTLRWQNCEGDGGTQNRTFACDSNAGNSILAASFTLDTDMHEVVSDELVVDFVTASPTLSPWWEVRINNLQPLACRNLALSISAQDGSSCPDLFSLMGSMNIAALQPFLYGPNSTRLLCVNAVPINSPVELLLADHPAGNATWGVARWTITNIRTVGTPSCAGCLTPACLVFSSCNITVVGNTANRRITGGASPGSDFVTWQGGGGTNCPAATPTRNATWGAVKSLFR